MSWYGRFAPYVRVADRKLQAAKTVAKLKKKGQTVQPVIIEGRTIANTFWGKAWCTHLETYSDYENRLPRGRTYVRNGSVIDLKLGSGEIKALVSGASIYNVNIVMSKVSVAKWNGMVNECAGKIDSLVELLQGKFSKAVIKIITDPTKGLFPNSKEIKFNCSCPDGAVMCKHIAAVLYGVGARLDEKPEELFLLRQADHLKLIARAGTLSLVSGKTGQDQILADSDVSSLFGIDIEATPQKKVKSKSTASTKKQKIPDNKKTGKKNIKATRTKKTIKPKVRKAKTS